MAGLSDVRRRQPVSTAQPRLRRGRTWSRTKNVSSEVSGTRQTKDTPIAGASLVGPTGRGG
jgi:hypothetical protein